jgi:endoglucanase
MLGTAAATTHFVVDTSRNGRGPWKPPSKYPSAGAAQDWCNPPLRGLGVAPTDATAAALDDAYLWVKVPGESDGSCNRGSSTTVDPEWAAITGNPGFVDPAAGQWFPQQALQLAQLARPALQ